VGVSRHYACSNFQKRTISQMVIWMGNLILGTIIVCCGVCTLDDISKLLAKLRFQNLQRCVMKCMHAYQLQSPPLTINLPLPLQTSANYRTDKASSCSNGNATPATCFHGDHSWWQPTGRGRSIEQRQWNPEGQGDNTHTHQTAKMAETRSRCKMNNEYY